MIYVLDASVILKWFLQEPDSADALRYRDYHMAGTANVACPDLALYEIGNTLCLKRGVPEEALLKALGDLFRLALDILSPTEALLQQAARVASSRPITFYDAVYVALAQELEATFVSADLRLCHQIRGLLPIELLSPP